MVFETIGTSEGANISEIDGSCFIHSDWKYAWQ